MKLEEAQKTAEEFVELIRPYCSKIEVCGSIRRKKDDVKDIDIVITLKNSHLPIGLIPGIIIVKKGKKLIELEYKRKQIDIYIATDENFEVLKMIRTGSANFNKMLCMKAIEKGWRLKFDMGLVNGYGNVIANTEEGILKNLLGDNVKPEDRR